jgi:hypothetical protein
MGQAVNCCVDVEKLEKKSENLLHICNQSENLHRTKENPKDSILIITFADACSYTSEMTSAIAKYGVVKAHSSL